MPSHSACKHRHRFTMGITIINKAVYGNVLGVAMNGVMTLSDSAKYQLPKAIRLL